MSAYMLGYAVFAGVLAVVGLWAAFSSRKPRRSDAARLPAQREQHAR
jgi:hypothetical protein